MGLGGTWVSISSFYMTVGMRRRRSESAPAPVTAETPTDLKFLQCEKLEARYGRSKNDSTMRRCDFNGFQSTNLFGIEQSKWIFDLLLMETGCVWKWWFNHQVYMGI